MKNILIISENDLTAVKLTELYHSIYSHTTKELILCTLDLSECRSGGINLPYKKPTTKILANAPNPLRNYLLQSKPKKRINVKNCKEIVDIIKNVDLLYHEATFLSDRDQLATKTGHSTALQAGKMVQNR